MSGWVDYEERSPMDVIDFALVAFGILLALAGVVMVSAVTSVIGLVLIGFGLIYFRLTV